MKYKITHFKLTVEKKDQTLDTSFIYKRPSIYFTYLTTSPKIDMIPKKKHTLKFYKNSKNIRDTPFILNADASHKEIQCSLSFYPALYNFLHLLYHPT